MSRRVATYAKKQACVSRKDITNSKANLKNKCLNQNQMGFWCDWLCILIEVNSLELDGDMEGGGGESAGDSKMGQYKLFFFAWCIAGANVNAIFFLNM